jgi:hypothetical protein
MSSKKSKRNGAKHKPQSTNPLIFVIGGVALIGVAALLIFGGGGGAASSPPITPEVSGAPKLKANTYRIDLGDVRLGEWVSASFEIVNAGDQPLRFTEEPYVEVVEGC